MARASHLTDRRLDLLYEAHDFGGETTMRARVIRELIDEIRLLREELASRDDWPAGQGPPRRTEGR